jgi:CRP-like cAMP-binding protein
MYNSLLKYINSYANTPLNESEIELIKSSFISKKIRKKQYFLQEGEVCKYAAFIVKGSMRQYRVDDKGIEHIVGLFIENWWVADRESYVMLTSSLYNIDAWEDTDALLISKADYLNYLSPIASIKEMTLKMDEKFAFATQKRLNAFNSLTAEQRYSELANTYPEFLQRFPQHLIASYLGISRETLSRIRRSAAKK